MMTRLNKLILRTVAAMGALLLLGTMSITVAQAHVSVDSAQPNSDGTTTLDFAFNHGCGLSPTTALAIEFPVDSEVTPTSAPPGWRSSIAQTTESTKVSWTGPAIPNEKKSVFAVTLRLSGSPGQTVWFPAVQTCKNGDSYDWVETNATAKEPAPSVVLTAAMVPPTGNASDGASTSGDSRSLWIALAGIIGLAVVAGTVAYLRERKE